MIKGLITLALTTRTIERELLASAILPLVSGAQVPVFTMTPVDSPIKPFTKIADRVEMTVNLKAKRTSGPAVALKPQPAGTTVQESPDAAVGPH